MADRKNQHFVPQFYFRLFSTTGKTICTLLTRSGKIIPSAAIKHQCARNNFYGSKELESLFNKLEDRHSSAIRAALDIAWNRDADFFSSEEWASLLEAVIFQRSRTALEVQKHQPAQEKMILEMFKHHLRITSNAENLDEIIRHIDAGNVHVTEKPEAVIARHVSIGLENVSAITDLRFCLLRNRTDYPFIFSDAPVVFHNSYCKNVRNRGVLGLQCPGLQILFPLNSQTAALFFDGDKYQCTFGDYIQHDVVLRSDVSQLNALQLHHSLNAAYFGHIDHQDYVRDLWNTHRCKLTVPKSEFRVGEDFLIDGERPNGELLHGFEPQLDFDLGLSFIKTTPIEQHEYVYAPRNANLRESLNASAVVHV